MYAENDHRRLGVHLIVTTIDAFIGGYLSLRFISEFSKFSMIFSAFFVAGLLLYLVRYRKWR
jgi:undecaprenyl pyrophosphate phosphatase UppP